MDVGNPRQSSDAVTILHLLDRIPQPTPHRWHPLRCLWRRPGEEEKDSVVELSSLNVTVVALSPGAKGGWYGNVKPKDLNRLRSIKVKPCCEKTSTGPLRCKRIGLQYFRKILCRNPVRSQRVGHPWRHSGGVSQITRINEHNYCVAGIIHRPRNRCGCQSKFKRRTEPQPNFIAIMIDSVDGRAGLVDSVEADFLMSSELLFFVFRLNS